MRAPFWLTPLILVLVTATAGCERQTRGRSDATITRTPIASVGGEVEEETPRRRRRRPRPRPIEHAEQDWRAAYATHPAQQTLQGQASYYSDSLAGRSTASGEPYDPQDFTAASRDLPFGTVLRVVRRDTGASTLVRVNDRGPFGRRERIVDLSRAAAEELDMIRRGVVDVDVEILVEGERRR